MGHVRPGRARRRVRPRRRSGRRLRSEGRPRPLHQWSRRGRGRPSERDVSRDRSGSRGICAAGPAPLRPSGPHAFAGTRARLRVRIQCRSWPTRPAASGSTRTSASAEAVRTQPRPPAQSRRHVQRPPQRPEPVPPLQRLSHAAVAAGPAAARADGGRLRRRQLRLRLALLARRSGRARRRRRHAARALRGLRLLQRPDARDDRLRQARARTRAPPTSWSRSKRWSACSASPSSAACCSRASRARPRRSRFSRNAIVAPYERRLGADVPPGQPPQPRPDRRPRRRLVRALGRRERPAPPPLRHARARARIDHLHAAALGRRPPDRRHAARCAA